MKNFKVIILTILFAAISVLNTSCQSLNSTDPVVRIERSIPYLRASSILITNGVFNYAVSEEDREAKAKIVYEVAEVIYSLTTKETVDINSVAEIVSYYVPVKSHWNEFATSLILIYADIHARASELDETNRVKVLVKALNAIAGGCKAAAKIYIKE